MAKLITLFSRLQQIFPRCCWAQSIKALIKAQNTIKWTSVHNTFSNWDCLHMPPPRVVYDIRRSKSAMSKTVLLRFIRSSSIKACPLIFSFYTYSRILCRVWPLLECVRNLGMLPQLAMRNVVCESSRVVCLNKLSLCFKNFYSWR